MSHQKNIEEAKRWLLTAQDDLDAAFILKDKNKNAHSCFHSQQAAEKAIKALWYYFDLDPWGHSITRLVKELEGIKAELFAKLKPFINDAKKLDRFYIPTRYPNGLPDITPDIAYSEEDSQYATSAAEKIIKEIKKTIK